MSLPLTPRVKRLLTADAPQEAVGYDHTYVGTEHVFLALVSGDFPVIRGMLEKMGFVPEEFSARAHKVFEEFSGAKVSTVKPLVGAPPLALPEPAPMARPRPIVMVPPVCADEGLMNSLRGEGYFPVSCPRHMEFRMVDQVKLTTAATEPTAGSVSAVPGE